MFHSLILNAHVFFNISKLMNLDDLVNQIEDAVDFFYPVCSPRQIACKLCMTGEIIIEDKLCFFF